jgi:rod shape-determining protein MreC
MGSKVRLFLISFITVGLLFFVFNRVFFFSPTAVESVSSCISYPMLLAQRTIITPLKQRADRQNNISALQKELGELLYECDTLRAQNIALSASLSFADQISEVREFTQRYEARQLQLTQILLKHISDDGHYLLVDGGANKDIEPDMVAVYKNCLLGKVVEVYDHFCKVQLISDPACKVAAYCINSGIQAIHQGTGRLEATELAHVSHLLKLQENDLIISSGEGLVFPHGFGLGMVESFEPSGLYYKVKVRPLINIHAIDYCYLMHRS